MFTLPANLIAQKNKKNQDKPWLVTLDVTLPDGTTKFHFVNNGEDLPIWTEDYDEAECVGQWKMNENAASTAVADSIDDNDGVAEQNTNLMKSLVGHWKLNETGASDQIADSSVQANNGTAARNADQFTVAGKINTALHLNGSSDKIVVGDDAIFDFSRGFSVSIQANPDATDVQGALLQRYDAVSEDGYMIGQWDTGSGVWLFNIYIGGVLKQVTSDDPPTGGSQHIVCTWSVAGLMQMYVDGVLQADTETNVGAIDSDGDLVIGANWDEGSQFFDGVIDDVRIYQKELSAADVAALYNDDNGTEDEVVDLDVLGNSVPYFNGIADFVTVADDSVLDFGTGDFSVSLRFKSEGYTNYGSVFNILISKGEVASDPNYWLLAIQADNKLWFCIEDYTDADKVIYGNDAVNDGLWHHVVIGRNSGVMFMYVDNVLQTDTATSSDDVDSAVDLIIGGDDQASKIRSWNGNLDNIVLFSRALTAKDVAFLYNDGDGVETIPLIYTAANFEIDPIKKTSDKHSPSTELRVANVNRFLRSYLRDQDITDGTTIEVKAITAAFPGENYTETTLEFDVLGCRVDANWVYFTLGAPTLLTAPCPGYKFRSLHCGWRYEEIECGYSRKTVADVTLSGSDPVSVEVTAHGFSTGDSIRLAGIAGITPDMAGSYEVTVTDADNFTLDGTDSSDYSGSYTSGGTAGYATCDRTLSDCRDRENADAIGAFAGIRSGTIQVVG